MNFLITSFRLKSCSYVLLNDSCLEIRRLKKLLEVQEKLGEIMGCGFDPKL